MHNELKFIISEEEKALADKSIDLALEAGASAVQVTLDKARTEIYALLDGEIDIVQIGNVQRLHGVNSLQDFRIL